LKTRTIPPETKKILVIMTDYHLGDFIMALPTIEALAGYFNNGISLAVRQFHQPLAERLPSAAKITIYTYDAGRKARNLSQHTAFSRLSLQLMVKRFQTVLCVSYRIPCSMLALLTLSPHRIGLTSARRRRVFNDLLSPRNAVHKLDFYATLLERIGQLQRPPVVGPLADQACLDATDRTIAALAGQDNCFAVIHPFTGQAVRSWPMKRFVAVADHLMERYGLKICLIGSPGEREKLAAMRLLTWRPDQVAVVAESMAVTLALLTRMSLFFGNMSGPSHLAGLISDVPIVCISGPTDKEKWKPLRHDRISMLSGEVCPGKCKKQNCQLGFCCIQDVQVDDVMAAIEKFTLTGLSPHPSYLTSRNASRRAVFLDRDGTINIEKEYLHKIEDFEFIPGAPEAIKRLKDAGFLVIVVSNQSGVARGYFDEQAVDTLHEHIQAELAAYGTSIDAFYFCPHHPVNGVDHYQVDCDCRKGAPGMLLQAAREHEIDLQRSFMIGDKLADIEAGQRAGCQSILVLTGYGETAALDPKITSVKKCRDLSGAVSLVLHCL
jgi:D-glycero-D-manno-heptose 1,7-bisphosphate phosphatase